MYEVTVSPWDSQTLASPILWTAVKYVYIRKIITRMKIETKVYVASTFQTPCSYFFKNWAAKTGQAMAWLAWPVPTALYRYTT